MSKVSKSMKELIHLADTEEGKKEVVDACLYVLKHIVNHEGPLSKEDIQRITGAGCPSHYHGSLD